MVTERNMGRQAEEKKKKVGQTMEASMTRPKTRMKRALLHGQQGKHGKYTLQLPLVIRHFIYKAIKIEIPISFSKKTFKKKIFEFRKLTNSTYR